MKNKASYDMVTALMKKRILFLSFIFVLFLLHFQATESKKHLVDRVVAVINNDVITQSEFDAIFRPIYEQMQSAYQGPDFDRQIQDVRLKLLNQMIEDRLVYQESKKMGIEVPDAEVNEEMKRFKKQFPDEATFMRGIEEEGIGIKQIEQRLRERIAIQNLHEGYIRAKVVVAPTAVEQYYKEHPNEFDEKEKVEVWIITFVKSEEASEKGTTDEAAKKRAQKTLRELKDGLDFTEAAKRYSEDTHAKEGGYLGFIEKGNLVANIEKIIFALPPGGLTDVLETERAYHIFKVGNKTPAKGKSFEEAKELIYELLYRKKAHERFLEWMEELKKKSFISIR